MAEYIEREAFKAEILRLSTHYLNEWDTLGVLAAADRIPAADVRPEKRGKWVKTKEYYTAGCAFKRVAWKCSCCGIEVVNTEPIYRIDDWYYCPNCGADMREEAE